MTEVDWSYSMSKFCALMILYYRAKQAVNLIKSTCLQDRALKYRIKGLHIILNPSSASIGQLNEWRSKYLQTFLYMRDSSSVSYNQEDKSALSLHALYFSGILYMHQHQMMVAFEGTASSSSSSQQHQQWTDYFSSSTTKTKTHVEKSLCSCMNPAYGFIQVIKLLVNEKDICQLPHMMDALSAACTVLYFGNKVMVLPTTSTKKSKSTPHEALSFILQIFSYSPMMQ